MEKLSVSKEDYDFIQKEYIDSIKQNITPKRYQRITWGIFFFFAVIIAVVGIFKFFFLAMDFFTYNFPHIIAEELCGFFETFGFYIFLFCCGYGAYFYIVKKREDHAYIRGMKYMLHEIVKIKEEE